MDIVLEWEGISGIIKLIILFLIPLILGIIIGRKTKEFQLNNELKMKNWLLVLIGLVITFIGVITKKFFFLFLIFPLSLLWEEEEG